ncbi:MAG: hypothetical protein HQL05_04885 [Nitrospirae bacterium]|uniref:hypothetical protein n=1 Tax=Candidatus Magnetobacterium casense TaxID=1455061 RepID=UPI000695F5A6|nr:hypothetical protein [Candidatus Magnetobacterium casensis]MBF0337149.1 hypothetical protein [Nitrospirota bacterium]
MVKEEKCGDCRLYNAVKRVAMKPDAVKQTVDGYRHYYDGCCKSSDGLKGRILVADKIVNKYSNLAALVGSVTAIPSIIPGIGTVTAIAAGMAVDVVTAMKYQVDMCLCLCEAFGYDTSAEQSRQLAFLLAAAGTLEKAGLTLQSNCDNLSTIRLIKSNLKGAAIQLTGANIGIKVASDAGVTMIQHYLQGAALHILKDLFSRIGINFTRKAVEKSLPYGVGVVLGGTLNYALTKYVGVTAKNWFVIEQANQQQQSSALTLCAVPQAGC